MTVILKDRLDASSYLTGLLARFPEIKADETVSERTLETQIDAVKQAWLSELGETDQIKTHLRELKSRFTLLWSIAELGNQISFDKLGRFQSRFADASIELALSAAWASKDFNKLIDTRKVKGIAPGVFILGLGKLGGLDLNFSSDVDLIAFYDSSTFPKPRVHAATYVISRLLHLATHILTDTEGGIVWRVDWRLRPYASTHSLTMPTSTAIEFYHYHAQSWHRLAMIKARVVAGDRGIGNAFLSSLRSFLWRQDLDYRSIDEIAELKAKINLEHPELRTQRLQNDCQLDQVPDFNLKLGYGGIREIEFLVNALQLVWGGRKPQLRTTNSLEALEVLVDGDLIKPAVGSALKAAYVFFRQAENRLQMMNNDQVYQVPTEAAKQIHYIALLGYADWTSFEQACINHRQLVYREFVSLFTDTKLNQTNQHNCEFEKLSEAAQQVIERWQDGFRDYGVLPGQAMELKPLANQICQIIEECGIDPSVTVMKIDTFFTRLPPGGQYLRLLQTHPALAVKWLKPLLLSESMAVLITQTPHLIDRFLEANTESVEQTEMQLDANIVFFTRDYETRLEHLRRLTNEELYFRYLHYLQRSISPRKFEHSLTRLAENLLVLCVRVACDEMQLDAAPIAIIGFGKLGMQALMPQSDLDLVYLFEHSNQLQVANQFASRLQTIINVKMKQGRVYELDTRLRPSGQSGSVTISLSSFEQHQIQSAQTWSHLALFPARFVAGNTRIGAKFTEIRRSLLSRRRETSALLLDTRSMLERVRAQRIKSASTDQFTAKLIPGGLMELEYLISCLALKYAPNHPEILSTAYDDAVMQLSRLTHIDLISTLNFLRTYQLEIRLFGYEDQPFDKLPQPVMQHVLQVLNLPPGALSNTIEVRTKVVRLAIDQFYSGLNVERLKGWKERSVVWADSLGD